MSGVADIPVRVLAIATAVALVPLAVHASHSLARLETSRSALQMLRTRANGAPELDTSPRSIAGARLTRHLQVAAKNQGVRLRPAGAAIDQGDLMTVPVDVTGSQAAVLAFVDALETGPGPIRFRTWQLQRLPDGVRLTGESIALSRSWR